MVLCFWFARPLHAPGKFLYAQFVPALVQLIDDHDGTPFRESVTQVIPVPHIED
jgi:hypothetical protein